MRRPPSSPPYVPLALAWLVVCLSASPIGAQCATAVFSTPDDAEFGASVAVHADLALVGDPTGASAGVAWLLERGPWNWNPAAQFLPQPGTAGNARYGEAVALEDGYAVVGAPGEAGAAGAIYVYHHEADGWKQVDRLLAPDAAPGAEFGAALSLDGARLAVGAPRDDEAAEDAGAVYLFDLGPDGVLPAAKLLGEGALQGDGVGASVALDAGLLAAGTRSRSMVWIFEEGAGGFSGAAVLALPDAGQLGQSLALHGDRLLAGSPGTHATGIQSGAAHLFERDGADWTLLAELEPPKPMIFARFGASVALDDMLAVVGAPSSYSNEGSVHVYREQADAWAHVASFQSLSGPDYSELGGALDVDGDVLVAGASPDFGPPGVVYVFGGFRPWDVLGGGVAGAGGVPQLSAQGTLCGGAWVMLTVNGGKPAAPVLFVVGFSTYAIPFHGGTLWPAPDLLHFDVLDAAGTGALIGTWPLAQPGMQPLYAQAWVADASAPDGLAGSDALRAVTP